MFIKIIHPGSDGESGGFSLPPLLSPSLFEMLVLLVWECDTVPRWAEGNFLTLLCPFLCPLFILTRFVSVSLFLLGKPISFSIFSSFSSF